MGLGFGMSLCLVQAPVLQQRQLLVFGGATETIFPHVEELLRETEYQKALKYVPGFRHAARSYRSMIDCLFAQVMGRHWVRVVMRFYRGRGPKLLDIQGMTWKQISDWELSIIQALDQAHAAMRDARSVGHE